MKDFVGFLSINFWGGMYCLLIGGGFGKMFSLALIYDLRHSHDVSLSIVGLALSGYFILHGLKLLRVTDDDKE